MKTEAEIRTDQAVTAAEWAARGPWYSDDIASRPPDKELGRLVEEFDELRKALGVERCSGSRRLPARAELWNAIYLLYMDLPEPARTQAVRESVQRVNETLTNYRGRGGVA